MRGYRSIVSTSRTVRLVAVLAGVLSLVLAGCSSHGTTNSSKPVQAGSDQPSPANKIFTTGMFDNIPHYPRSQTLAAPSQTNGVAEQSFAAQGATPEQVVRWYTTNLTNGWSLTDNPHATGTDAWQASWVKSNQRLVVTASKATTLPNEGAAVGQQQVQYTIQVYPPPSQG